MDRVVVGELALDGREAHHVRDVLRLKQGDGVEVFDDGGRIAAGTLARVGADEVIVVVGAVSAARVEGR